jgi:hypothetical protein
MPTSHKADLDEETTSLVVQLRLALGPARMEVIKAGGDDLPATPKYDQVNFYHLAKWFSKNKPGPDDTILLHTNEVVAH